MEALFQMWIMGGKTVEKAGLFIYLAVASLMDIKTKKVSVRLAVLAGLTAAGMWMFFSEMEFGEWIFGILPGLCLLLLGKVTGEAIGYGDGAAVIVCGMFLGFRDCVGVLMLGLFLTCPVSLFLIVCRRATRKSRMPFLPFLLAGYIVRMLII